MKDLNRLRQQVQAAWAKVPLETKAKLELKMAVGHFHTLAARKHALSAAPRPPRELAMLQSLLHGDPDQLLSSTSAAVPQGLFTTVDTDGAVYFGNVDYDATDPGWAYCLPAMIETMNATPPFKVGNVIQIPDNTSMAILGDWGGWNGPAQSIAAAAKSSAYLVHIGDVYYAGTNSDGGWLDPYEPTHFVNVWPGVAGRSFALNSNHDMYAHATGYALTTLAAPAFQAQGGNCFALCNQAFRFVGLDSAYYAPDNRLEDFPGYMKGYLGDPQGPQMAFLKDQIAKLTAGQTLVLLTHHNGLNLDGSIPKTSDDPYQLWQQVTQVLQRIPAAASKKVLWYYGHEHAGAVYKPQQAGAVTVYPRCNGHGCIPWGLATILAKSTHLLWFEKKIVGPGSNYFVTNGYATLALNGASLTEAFFDQNGKQSWSGTFP